MLKETLDNWIRATELACSVKQRSPEWLEMRKTIIGGSSISTIVGVNRYKSKNALLNERLSNRKPFSSTAMQWGNLFEDINKKYAETKFSTSIVGCDLFVRDSEYIAYSPDGLGVVDDKIVMFEFKCPFSKPPQSRPPEYVAQVQMGLDVLKLPAHGILAQAVFRRCSFEQLDWTSDVDSTLSPMIEYKAPLACGLIGVYSPFVGGEPRDLGVEPVPSIKGIINKIDYGTMMVRTSNILYFGEQINIDELKSSIENIGDHDLVGWMPWKLLHYEVDIIEKKEGFLDQWRGTITEMMENVKEGLAKQKTQSMSPDDLFTC